MASSCTFSTLQGIFNLTALPVLEIFDANAWTYVISPCHGLSPWQAGAACLDSDGRGSRASAYQLQYPAHKCARLGNTSQPAWAPLVGRVGIALTLGGGDLCVGGVARSLRLSVACPVSAHAAPCPVVSEPRSCSYEAEVRSAVGCPLQCARDGSGAVCGGLARGACALIDGAVVAACQCARGFAGPSCSINADGGIGSAPAPALAPPSAQLAVADHHLLAPFPLLALSLLATVVVAANKRFALSLFAVTLVLAALFSSAALLAAGAAPLGALRQQPSHSPPPESVLLIESGIEDGGVFVVSGGLAAPGGPAGARPLHREAHALLADCEEADTPAPAFLVYPGFNGPCYRIGGDGNASLRSGSVVSVPGGTPCCSGGVPRARLTHFTFACGSGAPTARVVQPSACGHDIVFGSPTFCGDSAPSVDVPSPVSPCPAQPRGSWQLAAAPESKDLGFTRGDFAATYYIPPPWQSHAFIPEPACRSFDARDTLECFRNARIFFLGDSTQWDGLRFAAVALTGCGPGAPHAQGPRSSAQCDDVRAWLKRSEDPGASDPGVCLSPRSCTTPLYIASHNITLRALRYKLLRNPEHWERPFWDELLMRGAMDPRNTVILLNIGAHELHYDEQSRSWNQSAERYLAALEDLMATLVAAPAWRSPGARASGLLAWRSLFATEHPAARAHLGGALEDPVSWHRDVDARASAIVARAGFPVVNLSGAAFVDAGNSARVITYDSTHFRYAEGNQVFSFAWAQLCALLKKRRAA